ncbi:MAG TPA: HD domain-containing phosphohydrolase [Terriglobales bacterium]|jgi:diguanylate cyclase (GGDEF)-like protein/putative nucleotidyltransferase with HDIG domain
MAFRSAALCPLEPDTKVTHRLQFCGDIDDRLRKNRNVSRGRQFIAHLFIACMAIAALACFGVGLGHWQSGDLAKFSCYLVVALLTSSLKIKLPGVNGTMSVNFLFILVGVLELSFAETLVIGTAAALVQSYWKSSKRLKPVHVVFNVSQMPVGTAVAYGAYRLATSWAFPGPGPLALVLTAVAYFGFNTLVMSAIIWLTEEKPILRVWKDNYFWSLPYYMGGAAIVIVVSFLNRHIGWQSALVVLPPVYLIYRSYRLYLSKLEDEKRHVEQVSALHLQTIEALALAIEAKDQTTHEHLQRVRVYAMEVARELGLSEGDVEALRAASVLHDIGKLAVPEHIISKPGKLTPEEFEKMKIHPIVGAEILEQVDFPYPVVPIVRAHHEKWDGSGYPQGLQGEAIPIGARILAAVDCLDALASDRQYRRALPLDEAMARVASEAGTSFDPKVVAILQRRYIELERKAHAEPAKAPAKLSTDIKVERGLAPAAGFAGTEKAPPTPRDSMDNGASCIIIASHRAQELFDLSSRVTLDDTLGMLSLRLRELVPHDAMAVYLRRQDELIPEFVSGDNFRLFASLRIPIGQGLSGWVAQNSKPILNGNPSVEPGYLNDPTKYSTLRSAIAVPIEAVSGVVAVLALYRSQADAFTKQHLRLLTILCGKLGFIIENSASTQKSATDTVDPVTGLPNTGSILSTLDREIERCRQEDVPLTLTLCQINGFPEVSARFGSLKSDALMRALAEGLRRVANSPGFIGAVGTGEFVLISPECDVKAVGDLPSRIANIVDECVRGSFAEAQLTPSISHASCPADGETPEAVLREAHRRIFAARAANRGPQVSTVRARSSAAGMG